MFNLIRADFFKIWKSAAVKILFLVSCLCAAAMAAIASSVANGRMDASMSGIGFLFSDVDVIGILGGVCAAVLICSDFDNKAIHDAVAGGCGRFTVVAAKAVVLAGSVITLLIPYAVAAGIGIGTGSKFGLTTPGLGFLNLLTATGGTALTAAQGWELLGLMLLLLLVYAAQLSLCLPLAVISRKPVVVIAVYYAFSVLSGQLSALAKSSKLASDLFALTPYGGNYSLLTLSSGAADLVKAVLVSLIFIIAMVALTFAAFRKAEIK